ncbi:FtsK/SpoIIIE domain-containing protein [Paenarthrobacter sp.]|uniref:FtsK/SpoIIIE domain-containing protein n=1 Tax=Paenarthrobacter sp. TaxID=1931993 RepID=UPI002811B7D7|nr:FtsK/SpoIIIE domain-containing protein [Paenarthrobacter sp.]
MALECTLVCAPGAPRTAGPEELSIAVPQGTSGAHVQQLLIETRGTGVLSVDGQLLATLTVGLPPLISGAVIVDGSPPHRDTKNMSLPLIMLTHSGPGSGSAFRIQRGRYCIGRGSFDISLPDPGMSREQASLEVSSTALMLRAVGGANPVFVDNQPVQRKYITSSSLVRCGNSTFTVVTDSGPFPEISTNAGRSVDVPLGIPHTGRAGNRPAMALAALLPLLAGVGLAVATGIWMYLGFTAVSAISLLVPLIAGRKGRRERRLALDRAVQEDIERRRHCSPSAAELIAAVHRASRPGHLTTEPAADHEVVAAAAVSPTGTSRPIRISGEGNDVWLRLGTRQEAANVRLVPDDPQFRPPPIGSAAMTLDPKHPVVTLCGHPAHTEALLRFVLMQLASFSVSADTPVIIFGRAGRLPLSARFLPRVTLTSTVATALAALHRANGKVNGILIMLDDPSKDEELSSALLKTAQTAAWRVIRCSGQSELSGDVIEISPSGTTGYLETDGERRHFIPDLVPAEVFDRFCRRVRVAAVDEGPGTSDPVPEECSLVELLPHGQRRVLRRWAAASSQDGLTAVLGIGHNGPLIFDFKRDGPHLLVAGTTGSGKSELLRTLVASLALSDSPDRTNFLFFDFKGGSGLRPLAGLPHCVGLLTDLSKHRLDRALVSLRGETRRREELFAAAGVSDLAEYRRRALASDPEIPYLVLVIDEFRMLVDEAPNSLRELMRVATIGRSLGIHLVMATQRPQGALSADIRANVTSSIALRVQSEAESVDIINTKAAASISVEAPGRAYLAKASCSPEEFQTASLSVSHATAGLWRDSPLPAVQSASQVLEPTSGAAGTSANQDSLSDAGAERVVLTVHEAWQRLCKPLPRRPVAAPLPSMILWHDELPEVDGPASGPEGRWAVGPLAMLDRPTHQVVEPLLWSPSKAGHLAMIGSDSSGMQECFRAASAMLATQNPQPHLYILDATGMLGQVNAGGRIGAAVSLHQLHLAARVLKRLAAEMERRRSAGEFDAASSPLVLIVAGWCSWATALRSGPFGYAEAILQDIIRDGCSVGVTVLISGERELVSARFFAAIQNRAYFPSGSSEESRFHWPRLPEMESLPGRAVVIGNLAGGHATVAQFRVAPENGRWPFGELAPSEPPFRVRPLPELLGVEDFRDLMAQPLVQALPSSSGRAPGKGAEAYASEGTANGPLWIGIGGDEALPVAMPLREHGVSVILGSARSGKSSVLASLHALNPLFPWVYPPDRASASVFWASVASQAAAKTLAPDSILLVDDAELLDSQGRQALAGLVGTVRGIILTATTRPALLHHLPLSKEIQTSSMGLVLAPGSPHDGELLGVRLESDRAGRPGRGFLISGADVMSFQGVLTTRIPPQAKGH